MLNKGSFDDNVYTNLIRSLFQLMVTGEAGHHGDPALLLVPVVHRLNRGLVTIQHRLMEAHPVVVPL